MEHDDRYDRILKVLKMAIAGRGSSYVEVERTIGRGHNYLSRIFTRRSELKVMDLLRAVDALGLPADQILGPLVLGRPPEPPPAEAAAAEEEEEAAAPEETEEDAAADRPAEGDEEEGPAAS